MPNRVLQAKRTSGPTAKALLDSQILESHCFFKIKSDPDKPKTFCTNPVIIVKNIGEGKTKKVCMIHLTA